MPGLFLMQNGLSVRCTEMQNAKCKMQNWNLAGWFRVRIVGRDDEDRLRSFARRYLAVYAHLGLTNRISTYNWICAPSSNRANCYHCDSCHGVPRSSRPTLLRCVTTTNPNFAFCIYHFAFRCNAPINPNLPPLYKFKAVANLLQPFLIQ